MRATYLFLKTEERRCDALSMFNITRMTFNMNINNKSNNKEMKVTLDDDYNDVFRRVISCPYFLTCFDL